MLWIPIVTSILFGLFALFIVMFIIDEANTKTDIRCSVILLMLCTWVIISTWILYIN